MVTNVVSLCKLCGKPLADKNRLGFCRVCQGPGRAAEREKPRPPPDGPTDAPPGSWLKVEVMRERDSMGRELHHPDDATHEDSMRTWAVRECRSEGDLKGVVRCVRSFGADEDSDPDLWAEFLAAHERLGIEVLVAECPRTGAIAGTACLSYLSAPMPRPRPAMRALPLSCRVDNVAVLPEFRRRGVATAILKECVSRARAAGAYKITLECRPELRGLYEGAGFRASGNLSMRIDLKRKGRKND